MKLCSVVVGCAALFLHLTTHGLSSSFLPHLSGESNSAAVGSLDGAYSVQKKVEFFYKNPRRKEQYFDSDDEDFDDDSDDDVDGVLHEHQLLEETYGADGLLRAARRKSKVYRGGKREKHLSKKGRRSSRSSKSAFDDTKKLLILNHILNNQAQAQAQVNPKPVLTLPAVFNDAIIHRGSPNVSLFNATGFYYDATGGVNNATGTVYGGDGMYFNGTSLYYRGTPVRFTGTGWVFDGMRPLEFPNNIAYTWRNGIPHFSLVQ